MKVSRLLLILSVLFQAAFGQEQPTDPNRTLYSQRATSLNSAYEHPVRLVSPDGKKTVSARTMEDPRDKGDLHIRLTVEFGGKKFRADLRGFNGEMAWAPDSRAFAVTVTEGGGGLGSRVYVFYVGSMGIRKLDVSRPIEQKFGFPVRCEVPVPPNTGFISWSLDSARLLVAAEVVNVSVCDCMGAYKVYEVNLPALTIARTYSLRAAKERFDGLMGPELRGENDDCFQSSGAPSSKSKR
jgi:hypothetical protein